MTNAVSWLRSRVGELSTHVGAALAASCTYAVANADDVVEAFHDITGANITRSAVRVIAALLAAIGGVMIGSPKGTP